MIQFMFNRLVLFVFFWAVNVSFVYASNLQALLKEAHTQIDYSSPIKVNFFEHQSFKDLVVALPNLKKEVENMLDKSLLSASDIYMLAHATQYLIFSDFIYYQNLFVNGWMRGKISNDVFSYLFFQSMNTSRRGFYLYRNHEFSQLIQKIIAHQEDKKFDIVTNAWLSKWSSGQLMRQDVIRVRKNGSVSDERVDSENYLNLGFIDASLMNALKDFRYSLLSCITLLIFLLLSFFIKRKRKEIGFVAAFMSGGLFVFYCLFYQGILIF